MSGNERYLTLTGHLKELRYRLIVSFVAILVAFVFTYTYSEAIYRLLLAPLMPALPQEDRYMAFTGVVEPFFTYLKVGILGAFVAASPVVLYQGWAFIVPALYEKEKRWFLPVVFVSILLFAAGVCFAFVLVMPFAFNYLIGVAGAELRPVLSMGVYLTLVTKLLIAFGAAFQVPLVILVLARLGIADTATLARSWKYALLIAVLFGAMLTPPDVVSQLLLAAPLMALYGLGILLAVIFGK